eukprot:14277709-Alexandrium_andersonii.AAC.1
MALPPNRPSGHDQRHLDSVFQLKHGHDLYECNIPGHMKYDMTRGIHTTLLRPAHESLHKEVAENPDLYDKLDELVNSAEWGEQYSQHPVVVASGGPGVFPLALYMDGLPYTKSDSLLGVYVYNLVSGTRHLVAVLRKSR